MNPSFLVLLGIFNLHLRDSVSHLKLEWKQEGSS